MLAADHRLPADPPLRPKHHPQPATMKTSLLAALLALGGCTQSDYFGDYHESSTVTYGMAGNSISSNTSGYWHESGITAPQGDVAIWNDRVNIHLNSNPPGNYHRPGGYRPGYGDEPCYVERQAYQNGRPVTILQPCHSSPYF